MVRFLVIPLAALFVMAACSDEQTSSPPLTPTAATLATATPDATAIPAATATRTPAPTPTPTPTPEPPPFNPGPVILPTVGLPPATPTATATDPLTATLRPIGRRVAVLRELFELTPLETTVITRAELGIRLREDLDEDLDEIAQRQALYAVLGIMDKDASLHDLLLSLYQEQVIGLFDSEDKRLYIVSDTDEIGALDEVTYAHEFTHGLQQQHFDIHSTQKSLEGNSDQALAYRGVVEGDATLAERIYLFQQMDDERRAQIAEDAAALDSTPLDSAPHVIQRQFIFPYREGLEFVATILAAASWPAVGSWRSVNQLHEDIPRSTEQVLHPEKYAAKEEPIEVVLPDVTSVLGGDWMVLREDTLGEFLLLAYLEDHIAPEEADAAAAGWGGDSYALFEGPEGALLLQTVIAWDGEDDAQEFFDAFVQFTSARTGAEWQTVEGDPSAQTIALPGQVIFAALEGSRTTLVFAPDTDTLETAVGAPGAG
jgi:hypothetical protein